MRKLTASETRTRFIFGSSVMERSSNYEDGYFDDSIVNEGAICNNDCYNCMLECPYKQF